MTSHPGPGRQPQPMRARHRASLHRALPGAGGGGEHALEWSLSPPLVRPARRSTQHRHPLSRRDRARIEREALAGALADLNLLTYRRSRLPQVITMPEAARISVQHRDHPAGEGR